jgi:hypothetical protein
LIAAIALSLTALKEMPGGSISPFCEPETTTSTPHSSKRKSIEARPEIVSTIMSAGCPTVSMAARTSATGETEPVLVSLCTMQTALIVRSVSARRTSAIRSASAPPRQSPSMNSGWSPSRRAIFIHSVAK